MKSENTTVPLNYEKLWVRLKSRLQDIEQSGNMLQQTMAYSYLGIMRELEKPSENSKRNE
jgi:hypothetical protein